MKNSSHRAHRVPKGSLHSALITTLTAFLVVGSPLASPGQTTIDTLITMNDGVMLDASVTYPQTAPPPTGYPGLILIHGYGGKRQDMEIVGSYLATFAYASLAYSVRGQGSSGGLSTTMGPREKEDLRAVVAFLRTIPLIDPERIGVVGGSQGGIHAWMAATDNIPGVAAAATIVGPPSFSLDLLPENCIKQQMQFELSLGSVRYDPLRDRVRDFVITEQYDSVRAFAESRDLEHLLDSVRIPVVQSAGWADVLFPCNGPIRAVNRLSSRGIPVWTYLGTNGHGEPLNLGEYLSLIDFMKNWFDRWLKDIPLPQSDQPLVVYADDRPGWPHHQTIGWPPQPHQTFRLYFAEPELRFSPPSTSSAAEFTLTYDPTYTGTMGWNDDYSGPAFQNAFQYTTVRFRSPLLDDTLEVTGIPTAHLELRSGQLRFQAHVRLFDVAMADTGEVWRLITRGHFGELSNIPGTTASRDIECQALSHLLPPHHRIGIELTSLDMYDGNRADIIPYFAGSVTSLLMDSSTPSYVDLPVVGTAVFATVTSRPTGIPTAVLLRQNYPNPFNPSTTISFSMAQPGSVRLEVFSALGERIAVVLDGTLDRGEHAVRFDGGKLASGVYLYRLTAGAASYSEKMLLVR